MNRSLKAILGVVIAVFVAGCASTRHVPEGSYLLDRVDIIVDSSRQVRPSELMPYLRQTPNHKVLGFARLQLGTYNLSGSDTSRWYNKWLRRIGQPPVIFDPALTESSRRQLRQALVNRGYLEATVLADTALSSARRKARVTYHVSAGTPRRIATVDYDIYDTTLRRLILADTARLLAKPGTMLDRARLDDDRTTITARLRDMGYYGFTKDRITFVADTVAGSHLIGLTYVVHPPRPDADVALQTADTVPHAVYRIHSVLFLAANPENLPLTDTASSHGILLAYNPSDRYISAGALSEKCALRPGDLFSAADVDRTYSSLARLGILRSINVDLQPTEMADTVRWLDVVVSLSRNKLQSVTLELEGTNSEGDLGFGVGLAYSHRDFGHRSNIFSSKIRVNYESLSGNLSGLINDRYTEYAFETGLTFPKFLFPFLSSDYRRRINATTEVTASFNYQERPEYTRMIGSGGWKYKWTAREGRERRIYDLAEVSYVRIPKSTVDFIDEITNPLLRYSYEDHFIVSDGYTYYKTNRRIANAARMKYYFQPSVFTLRLHGETAGNVLYALSRLTHQKRHEGVYRLFGTQYSQYVKFEGDYTFTRNFTPRQSLAAHAGVGIGVPYANSSVLPFEKRFYGGGANGVRGWSVRTLGPGAYNAVNSVSDFIYQCGDIRLDLSLEYRLKLFWVFEGAFFVDAGNIWTIRDYEDQPGGVFRADSFYRQIAAAYGVGLRMDFTYFLLRFDLGFKAHNPAMGQEHWPIVHPRWGRDTALHFAVGYPF